MNEKTRVSLPINTIDDELLLFKPYLSYGSLLPKIKYINSAFITSTGLVCAGKGLVKECCHYKWDQQSKTCFVQAYQFYDDAENNPENLMTFDDEETYLLIHHVWYKNYFHWINEAIYRLWLVKDKTDQMILLLPPENTLPQFALDSLQFFSFKNIIHIPDEKSAFVRTLCMPSQKPVIATFDRTALLELNHFFVNQVKSKKNLNKFVNERVYISRKKAPHRKIINEEEVIAILVKYDFTILYTEDHTFLEQIAIFSNVTYLISGHGAGLTNMLFMAPGTTVFEFHKRKTNPVRHLNLIFWYMADAMGHKYYHQICEPINDNEPFLTAHIMVDIDLLNKNLDLIFPN